MEPEDREAVLMQWERKIEQAERGGRFDRDAEAPTSAPSEETSHGSTRFDRFESALAQDTDSPAQRREAPRSSRSSPPVERTRRPAPVAAVATGAPAAERRTITITGQPTPPRRRPSLAERHIAAQPDRIALWAFLLGLLLIAVAAGTAHA